ncbi:hypothetical protein EVAR_49288_1 [Eumeta japonica]|uniref:Uncharacterized protein n=1 Tax=Eumeta variegata TaxID=151549 RepID=A0A4C1XL27_EUMVA|nr:hypothetical protein EVAR_49288_1 [Eumeta japonica]
MEPVFLWHRPMFLGRSLRFRSTVLRNKDRGVWTPRFPRWPSVGRDPPTTVVIKAATTSGADGLICSSSPERAA